MTEREHKKSTNTVAKELNRVDIIAYDAPLAQAILGKKLGDVVKFNSRTIVIKKIERI